MSEEQKPNPVVDFFKALWDIRLQFAEKIEKPIAEQIIDKTAQVTEDAVEVIGEFSEKLVDGVTATHAAVTENVDKVPKLFEDLTRSVAEKCPKVEAKSGEAPVSGVPEDTGLVDNEHF
jgi:hypothetical protein